MFAKRPCVCYGAYTFVMKYERTFIFTYRRLYGANHLTTEELSLRIKYDARTIRERLKDSVLLEGTHYIRPFGGERSFSSGSGSRKTWGALV